MKNLWAILFLAFTAAAFAQTSNDPLGTGHTHEGDVGKFYKSWMRPLLRNSDGERYAGCCGGEDCRPILGFQEHPGGLMYGTVGYLATWEILVNMPYGIGLKWVTVPDDLWEDNQVDPRESPDEHGHVCIAPSGAVLCAVRTSGQ